MTDQENVQRIQELYNSFGRGDVPAILELLTDDVVWYDPGPPEVPHAGRYSGREGVGQFFASIGETLEIDEFAPTEFLAQGDRVPDGLRRGRNPRADVAARTPRRRRAHPRGRAGLQGRAEAAQDGRQHGERAVVADDGLVVGGAAPRGRRAWRAGVLVGHWHAPALRHLYNRVLRPALRASGIAVQTDAGWDYQGVAFHAFRKACGSLLLSQGKNLKQVQGWLRHSQLTTTLNAYIHETDDGLGGADVWDGVLGATWGQPGATAGPGTAEVRKSPLLAETADLQAKP